MTALDLSELNVERARKLAVSRLADAGFTVEQAERLALRWIRHADFLLDGDVGEADFVLGNPPYIRLENVPPARTAAYRRSCPTMKGRSDVYVGFVERGLRLLSEDGVLGFIVADRWMHNQYGSALRHFVASGYAVEAVIEMHDSDAFEEEVAAYPAVTVIRRHRRRKPVVATATSTFDADAARRFGRWARSGLTNGLARPQFQGARLETWFSANELWPSGSPAALAVLADLESRFPSLESAATGTRVGIGVATGADHVYVTRDADAVESDRLLPLVTAADTTSGRVHWSGTYLVNPWDGGELIDLAGHPRLASYLSQREPTLRARHVARKRPA